MPVDDVDDQVSEPDPDLIDDYPEEDAADPDYDDRDQDDGQDPDQDAQDEPAADETPAPTSSDRSGLSAPAYQHTPWTPQDHQRLVETFGNLDAESMATAVEGMMARYAQQVLQQAAALTAAADPFEARVRQNLIALSAQDPTTMHNPQARQMAEIIALQQVAEETQRDPWEMLMEHAQRKIGTPSAQPAATPPPERQAGSAPPAPRRPTPPGLKPATPTVASAPPRGARGSRDSRTAAALAADLGGSADEYDVRSIRESARRQVVHVRR